MKQIGWSAILIPPNNLSRSCQATQFVTVDQWGFAKRRCTDRKKKSGSLNGSEGWTLASSCHKSKLIITRVHQPNSKASLATNLIKPLLRVDHLWNNLTLGRYNFTPIDGCLPYFHTRHPRIQATHSGDYYKGFFTKCPCSQRGGLRGWWAEERVWMRKGIRCILREDREIWNFINKNYFRDYIPIRELQLKTYQGAFRMV